VLSHGWSLDVIQPSSLTFPTHRIRVWQRSPSEADQRLRIFISGDGSQLMTGESSSVSRQLTRCLTLLLADEAAIFLFGEAVSAPGYPPNSQCPCGRVTRCRPVSYQLPALETLQRVTNFLNRADERQLIINSKHRFAKRSKIRKVVCVFPKKELLGERLFRRWNFLVSRFGLNVGPRGWIGRLGNIRLSVI
jgi:hypothetical protein